MMKVTLVNAADVQIGMYVEGHEGWWPVTGVRCQSGGTAVSWLQGPARKRYERLYDRGAMVSIGIDDQQKGLGHE